MRVIFFAGTGGPEWAPPCIDGEGLGGSETAVIHIAKRFHDAGFCVDVYNHAGRYEGEHEGVGYWEPARLGSDEECDLLVVWRNPAGFATPIRAKASVLWCHDHDYGPGAAADIANPAWDRVLGVSAYHARHLARQYGLDSSRVSYVPNGIDLSRFDPAVRKKPLHAVYASSADRGLMRLLDLWPRLIGDETGAKLTIAYGFQTMDALIQAGRRDLAAFKDAVLAKIKATPCVEFVGRLNQKDLAQLYSESVAWLYPTDFLETNCISAAESMAGGCVPVCSSVGALKETVGNGGIIVWGPNGTRSNPYSPAWQDFWVKCAQGVMFEMNIRRQAEVAARERAKALTWERSFQDHWLPMVEALA